MRRIVFWSVLALSLSANVAVAAIALGKGSIPHRMSGDPPLFSRVSLDAGQRARVAALRKKLMADREEQATHLAELRVKLAELLTADSVDRPAIDGKLVAIEAAQAGFQRRVVSHVLAVREVLGPEQRPAFFALVREHMRTGVPLDPTTAPDVQGEARR
jgi:Spy/CpxP family protein refolding chaperone